VTGRRGGRRIKLLDDLKERRGYCRLKEEALDRTMWRAGFGRGFGPVVRQTTKQNEQIKCSEWLRIGRSRDRIPVGARFSAPVQTGPGAHIASCTTVIGSFPGVNSGRGVKADHSPF